MVSEKEAAGIRRFVCGQLRDDEADLSTLTLGILKKRYQAHKKCDSLSPEVKTFMKQVVQEELMKMQVPVVDNKTESEESGNNEENAKSQADGEEQEVKQSQRKRNENCQLDSDESSDEELSESERKEKESNCSESPKKMVRKKGETRTSSKDEGRKTPQSDAENESDGDCKSETSEKIKSDESSDSEKGDHYLLRLLAQYFILLDISLKMSFSFHILFVLGFILQSDDKSVARLKRYIALCGVRRNYKKLLEECRSIRSQVAVLKKELEELGVHGQPTIQKCKKVRMKREQAQELAALDVNNIITTQGRPTRRGASASQKQQDCPSSEYQRTLNSDSDSDQENNTHRGRRKMSEWANLQGIISDDADSD
uniref:Histone chaperone domain-containing protein n=1 Tax=Oreochromis aureus TaxID=47969 RepID=A0A668SS49_OREAU